MLQVGQTLFSVEMGLGGPGRASPSHAICSSVRPRSRPFWMASDRCFGASLFWTHSSVPIRLLLGRLALQVFFRLLHKRWIQPTSFILWRLLFGQSHVGVMKIQVCTSCLIDRSTAYASSGKLWASAGHTCADEGCCQPPYGIFPAESPSKAAQNPRLPLAIMHDVHNATCISKF